MSRSIRISIALLSASLLTFQIVLLQAFSSVQWYHFAYMVISVALLGFGASGTVLTLGRRRFLRYHREAMVGAMVVSAATMPVSLILTQHPPARFDSYLLLTDPGQVGALILSYLFLAVPFFSGALAIGLAFVRYTKHMGALYFANLAGSGFGGIVGLALLFLASPPRLAAATGLMVALAAAFLLREGCSRRTRVGWALVLVMDTILLAAAPPLRPSEY